MPSIDFNRRTALYRLFDSDERLLYVGIAFDPEARWEQHRKIRHWWPSVASKAVEWHETRGVAAEAEIAAIAAERPKWNTTHAPLPQPIETGCREVRFVRLTDARPRLSDIVDDARDHGVATALTQHGKPRAVIVPVSFCEDAEQAAAVIEWLREREPELLARLEADAVAPKLSDAG